VKNNEYLPVLIVYTGLLGSSLLGPPLLAQSQECSIAKTNNGCTLTIDRRYPLAPPNIQMYAGQTITVTIKNGYYFERYFLDFQSGQVALAPDIATIIGSLLSNLSKLQFIPAAVALVGPTDMCSATTIAAVPAANVAGMASQYTQCFAEFADSAKQIYLALEPAAAPDSHSKEASALPSSNPAIDVQLKREIPLINDASAREAALSASIAAAMKPVSTATPPSPADLVALQGLSALAGAADAVAKDLFGYGQRINDLPTPTQVDITLGPIPDPQTAKPTMVTRQVTYALDALNMVQNSREAIPTPSTKKTILSLTIVYGDSRWEGSAGTLFSTLAIRSFSVAPIISNGAVTNKQVSESVLHPTVVPFAAANFRMSDDLKRPRWRMAWYWTFAAGGNPNTVSADFGTGPSLSFRGLMFSALWHLGHDVRATQGLYKNELLGTSFNGTATTQDYWRFDRVALGISVRIPALSGR
jgi:hypothetical protein